MAETGGMNLGSGRPGAKEDAPSPVPAAGAAEPATSTGTKTRSVAGDAGCGTGPGLLPEAHCGPGAIAYIPSARAAFEAPGAPTAPESEEQECHRTSLD